MNGSERGVEMQCNHCNVSIRNEKFIPLPPTVSIFRENLAADCCLALREPLPGAAHI